MDTWKLQVEPSTDFLFTEAPLRPGHVRKCAFDEDGSASISSMHNFIALADTGQPAVKFKKVET
jgi:hypothetical protein